LFSSPSSGGFSRALPFSRHCLNHLLTQHGLCLAYLPLDLSFDLLLWPLFQLPALLPDAESWLPIAGRNYIASLHFTMFLPPWQRPKGYLLIHFRSQDGKGV
jgi:hypothetical protein